MTEIPFGLYDFFRDQGSMIAGLLALLAGVLAYGGSLQQVRVVREQNTELKSEARRNRAREGIIAVRLLDGVLSRLLLNVMVSGSAVVSTAAVGVPPTELPRETHGRSHRDGRGPRKFAHDPGTRPKTGPL